MTFNEYVMNWWCDFTCANDSEALTLMSDILDCSLDEAKEQLGERQTPEEWVAEYDDADKLYEVFFGYGKTDTDWGLDTESFLAEMFKEACPGDHEYEDEFTDDMAVHASGYTNPLGFFRDLAYGGCQSGMIGMLIYHSDCKEVYGKYMDDMEDKKDELEEEFGSPIQNRDYIAHADFMCWLCYEELAKEIASELFPEKY